MARNLIRSLRTRNFVNRSFEGNPFVPRVGMIGRRIPLGGNQMARAPRNTGAYINAATGQQVNPRAIRRPRIAATNPPTGVVQTMSGVTS
jgi:hypothetical protein